MIVVSCGIVMLSSWGVGLSVELVKEVDFFLAEFEEEFLGADCFCFELDVESVDAGELLVSLDRRKLRLGERRLRKRVSELYGCWWTGHCDCGDIGGGILGVVTRDDDDVSETRDHHRMEGLCA